MPGNCCSSSPLCLQSGLLQLVAIHHPEISDGLLCNLQPNSLLRPQRHEVGRSCVQEHPRERDGLVVKRRGSYRCLLGPSNPSGQPPGTINARIIHAELCKYLLYKVPQRNALRSSLWAFRVDVVQIIQHFSWRAMSMTAAPQSTQLVRLKDMHIGVVVVSCVPYRFPTNKATLQRIQNLLRMLHSARFLILRLLGGYPCVQTCCDPIGAQNLQWYGRLVQALSFRGAAAPQLGLQKQPELGKLPKAPNVICRDRFVIIVFVCTSRRETPWISGWTF